MGVLQTMLLASTCSINVAAVISPTLAVLESAAGPSKQQSKQVGLLTCLLSLCKPSIGFIILGTFCTKHVLKFIDGHLKLTGNLEFTRQAEPPHIAAAVSTTTCMPAAYCCSRF